MLEINSNFQAEYKQILTDEALKFLEKLVSNFSPKIMKLLDERLIVQDEINKGKFPNFLEETKDIRSDKWSVNPIPDDLKNRKVEITGPVERKMIINALNSGSNVFMADFEDSNSPTWDNVMGGQVNLIDAINRTITFERADGKIYKLNENIATLFVRPRGLHLVEKNIKLENEPIPGCLVDFGLYFFHNAKKLITQGTGPYFYLPKLQHYLEARLWNDIFKFSQDELNIPQGTIKATVLIEHILTAFQMDEILYELKEHSAGLNCGRWDYIFSFIKTFQNHSEFVLPDRALITMEKHFLKSYVQLLINTCHKRNIHAMGGMAAQIPIKGDTELNNKAMEKVRLDKEREAIAGHDGTWVAHPGLIQIASKAFEDVFTSENQLEVQNEIDIQPEDLLKVPHGSITENGIRANIRIAIIYLESWISGNGCVPINNLMEDAATAEISRTQLWQWIRHQATTDTNQIISREYFQKIFDEEMQKLSNDNVNYDKASKLLKDLVLSEKLIEFLTIPAYEYIQN